MDATQAIILCAGLQQSYAYEDSKFMFDIAGRPAFSYTMESILEVFPESAVTIITSQRFQDFNAFINQAYPTATVVFDDNPGSGTALSLKKATPFSTKQVFVTEGTLYYKPHLIYQALHVLNMQTRCQVSVSITPDITVAPSHRPIMFEPAFTIAAPTNNHQVPIFRNIGAYAMRTAFQSQLNLAKDVIECIRLSMQQGNHVVPFIYDDVCFHTKNAQDVDKWLHYFEGQLAHPLI